MYYVVQTTMLAWRNGPLYAHSRERDLITIEFQEQWWKPAPITNMPQLSFSVRTDKPAPDNYDTGCLILIYSGRLIQLLREFGVQFETFPALFFHRKKKTLLQLDHQLFHLMDTYSAIDMDRSVFSSGWGLPNAIVEKYELKDEALSIRKPMFYDTSRRGGTMLMHEDLVHALEREGITGFVLTPVTSYKSYGAGRHE